MSERVKVAVFCEDRAHDQLVRPLVLRIACEEEVEIGLTVHNASGGQRRALKSFRRFQVLMGKGAAGDADLMVVAIDGNCSTFEAARRRTRDAAHPAYVHRLVVACPDPHVERWYLADPQSFETVVGSRPQQTEGKCRRDHYKRALATAVQRGGQPPTQGGIEFGEELAVAMDLYRAGRSDSSLKAFIDDLRKALRGL